LFKKGENLKHFQKILATIGSQQVNELISTLYWEMWSADFSTPAGTLTGYYLYLKSDCPWKEANSLNVKKWKSMTTVHPYDIIITDKSILASDEKRVKNEFQGRDVYTSKRLIRKAIFSGVEYNSPLKHARQDIFIDPDLELEDGSKVNKAKNYLTRWFLEASKGSKKLSILRANAGVGKTSLARRVAMQLANEDEMTIPLLVESEQWRSDIHAGMSLDSIWNHAISRALNKPIFFSSELGHDVLFKEGVFLIIFDGFDELCLNPQSSYTPDSLIEVFLELLGITRGDSTEEGASGEPVNARILLTTRETYWKDIESKVDLNNIQLFKLRGFSNEQKSLFFKERLQTKSERDTALRIASQISGKLYDGLEIEDGNAERFSGIPFILEMIATAVENAPEAQINPYDADPLAPLVEAVCKRENIRQNLDVSFQKQIELFEELFLDFPDEISFGILEEYGQVICGVHEQNKLVSLTNHFFLVKKEEGKYVPRHELLRVYFIARFLSHKLLGENGNQAKKRIIKALNLASSKKSSTIDWIATHLQNLPSEKLVMAVHHALEIIGAHDNDLLALEAKKSLFQIVNKIVITQEKNARTAYLAHLLNVKHKDGKYYFKKVVLAGDAVSYDFESTIFEDCYLSEVSFRNCVFGGETRFQNCTFEGQLEFNNCKNVGSIVTVNPKLSEEAEAQFDIAYNRSMRPEIRRYFAEEALKKALKKFKGSFGFSSILEFNRHRGMDANNPYSQHVWESLSKCGVTSNHIISGISNKGINVVEDGSIRRQIQTFLDNGYLGPALERVVNDMIQK
jgi:hypothetical protein